MVLKSTGVLTKGNKTAYLLFQETFEEMPEFFKEKLSSSVAAHLNRVLRKIDMDLFLPLLLEMILLKVKHAEENIADMRRVLPVSPLFIDHSIYLKLASPN